MRNKIFLRMAISLCLALALCLPAAGLAEEAEAKTDALQVITANTKLDLEPYRGKAVFLNFFTEWCPYCMQEMADIKQIFDEYSADELQIILVHVWDGEDASATERVKADHGLQDMTFFEDEDRLLSQLVGLQGYPASILIAKDGTLHEGFNYATDYETLVAYMQAMGVAKKADAV